MPGCQKPGSTMVASRRLRSVLAAVDSSLSAAVQVHSDTGYDTAALEATTRFIEDEGAPLTEEMIAQFMVEGYVVLPGILRDHHVKNLCADVDQLVVDRTGLHGNPQSVGGDAGRHVVSYEHLGKLCSHPPLVEKVKQLMACYGNGRADCAMHHIHASKHEAGETGAGWHQDYHCSPAVYDREQLMVHCFCCERSALQHRVTQYSCDLRLL